MRGTVLGIVAIAISVVSCGEGSTTPIDITSPSPMKSTAAPRVASIVVTLSSSSVRVGSTAQATALVLDKRSTPITGRVVTWSIESGSLVASISQTGVVTALGVGTATVKATVDGVSGSAVLTVPSLDQIVLSPTAVTLGRGATAQFTVAGIWSDGSAGVPAVTYSGTGGSITADGMYTADTTSGIFRVIATEQAGTKSDTSIVTIEDPAAVLLQLAVSPKSVTLAPGESAQFTVSGSWSDGSSVAPPVTYSATGGTITAAGSYAAGSTSGSFRVIATQQDGTKADTSTITISAPAVTLLAVMLTPASVTLTPGMTQQFSVTGSWSDGSSTKPTVTYSAGGGTITADGLYAAGAIPGLFKVIATQQGGTKSDTSMLTITPPPATSLAIVVQPSGAVSGVPFTQQPVIELRDAQNRPVLQSGVQVTASKASGSGTLQGTVTSTTNAQGRAAFVDLKISGTGSHTIAFAAPGLTSVTSATLTVTASTLRSVATARGFLIGAAVRDSAFRKDTAYRRTLATQYNSIVPEDATDFWPIHPGPSQYNFAAADTLVAFAQANGMAFHGHHLAWHAWIPTWVTAGGYTDAQIRDILKDHIMTVVGRYRGKAASWDVVNEVIDNQGCFTNNCGLMPSFWLTHLGPEYIDSAFVWAHRADPTAKLYLNEFRTETIMNKSDAVFALVTGLKSRGIPIDGVGFQVHILQQFWPAPSSADVQANFQRFADAGFDIRITEMDVAVSDTGGDAALTDQATVYENILNACLNVARCKELTTWGFSDRYSWIPKSFPGYGRALPFDSNYQPKPAFSSMLMRLGQP